MVALMLLIVRLLWNIQMTVCFCVHLFSRFVVTYVESFPTFATTFVQLPFSLKVNDFTKNPIWVTWNGLVHLINLYCNIVIAFETSFHLSLDCLSLVLGRLPEYIPY